MYIRLELCFFTIWKSEPGLKGYVKLKVTYRLHLQQGSECSVSDVALGRRKNSSEDLCGSK